MELIVHNGFPCYEKNPVGESDKKISSVVGIQEREEGVEFNISRISKKEVGSSFTTQRKEELNLTALSVEQVLAIVELVGNWLESHSQPTIDKTIEDVEGVHIEPYPSRQRQKNGEKTEEFDTLNVTVGEREIKFSYWDGNEGVWKYVSIPSSENVQNGVPTDFENIDKLYKTFYDFFTSEYSDEVAYFTDTEPANPVKSGVVKIEHIFDRFSEIAIPLQKRQAGKEPLTMEKEVDVQYLLGALLKLHFDDVRRESHTERHSSVSPRIDFLLQDETIGIEVKRASSTRREKALRKELAEDKEQYRLDTNIDTLLVFVYDPDKEITNKAAFEASFEQDTNQMTTRVTVTR